MAGFNHWAKLAEILPDVLEEIVNDTAIAAVANIQGEINRNGQVVSGAMRGNIYYVTAKRSTYGQGHAPTAPAYLLPEIPRPSDRTTASIGAAANYSIFQDLGTRYLPGRPFMAPGIERSRPYFEQQMSMFDDKISEVLK